MSYIFGPVPSRRLGRSLGVDVVPFKTCTYDCIYCQLGGTTCKTLERREWVPLEAVIAELKDRLATRPDYITLSGSGEPTLFARIGELIAQVKSITDVPVAVLTNGSLLWREEVRDQLMNADLIIPSLDAADEEMFRRMNRPCEGITFENMLTGLVDFRREFEGQYWLEILLLAGYTAIDPEPDKLAQCVGLIKPDRIQLNTATRPPAERYAVRVSSERMAEIAALFDPPAEIIAPGHGDTARDPAEFSANREDMLNMLRRRPCSAKDIADGLRMHQSEVLKYVEELVVGHVVVESFVGDTVYYKVKQ